MSLMNVKIIGNARLWGYKASAVKYPAPIARAIAPGALCVVGKSLGAPDDVDCRRMVFDVVWFVPGWNASSADECSCALADCLGRLVGDYHLPHPPSSLN